MSYSPLVSLDDGNGPIFLTDQGRTFDEPQDQRKVDVELASGNLKRYIKAKKHTWTFTWDWCPTDSSNTYDGFGGRDDIKNFAEEKQSLVMSLLNHPSNPAQSFTVFVENYDEKMLRRDYTMQEHFWNITLELKEV